MILVMNVLNNSIAMKGYSILEKWFMESFLYKIPCWIIGYVYPLYTQSNFKKYFNSQNSLLTSLYSHGIFYHLVSWLFLFINGCLNILNRLLNGSLTEKIGKLSLEDLKQNYLSYGSTFLFTALICYSLMSLLFGAGFTRSNMLLLIFSIFFLYGLSRLKGRIDDYISSSVIIKWIEKLYL